MVPADTAGEQRRAVPRASAADRCSDGPSRRSAHENPRATACAHSTAAAAGRCALTPRTQADSGRCASVSKWTICDTACTPASVRPAAITVTGCPAISPIARSSASCTPQPRRLRLEAAERVACIFDGKGEAHGGNRRSGIGNRKKHRAADQTTRRPWMLLEESRQASFASSVFASVFCWSSPSWSTSCRISRAPSTSPIS